MLKAIPLLLHENPTASFGFVGARTLDKASGKVESYISNQRFIVYSYIVSQKFGKVTFEHIEYPEISGYVLINRDSGGDIATKENAIKRMFANTYNNLPDI